MNPYPGSFQGMMGGAPYGGPYQRGTYNNQFYSKQKVYEKIAIMILDNNYYDQMFIRKAQDDENDDYQRGGNINLFYWMGYLCLY